MVAALTSNRSHQRGHFPRGATLRAEIEQLRDRAPATNEAAPARQRATEASLRQRLETLRAENQRLRDERSVKAELAIAYGQQRQAINA